MSPRQASVVLVFASSLTWACGQGPSTPPPDVVGTWIAQGQRYAGRGVTVTDRHVILYMGGNDVSAYPILSVRTDTMGDTLRIDVITYRLPGGDKDQLELRRLLGQPDVVHLRNTGDVEWLRSPNGVPLK